MDINSLTETVFWSSTLQSITLKLWALIKVLIFFFVVRFIAYRLINRVVRSISGRLETRSEGLTEGRLQTLRSLIRSVVFYVLIFISGVMILRVCDVDPAPVLTAAGVVGLAVGFGAQRLVRDVIGGFFTVLEDQYSVGEYVTIGNVAGTVVELGMRTTKLRDDSGKMVIIANGNISQVINHSRGPVRTVLEISVKSGTDPEAVIASLNSACQEVAEKVDSIVTSPEIDGMTAVDSGKITYRISAEVVSDRQFAAEAALREAIHRKLKEADIPLA